MLKIYSSMCKTVVVRSSAKFHMKASIEQTLSLHPPSALLIWVSVTSKACAMQCNSRLCSTFFLWTEKCTPVSEIDSHSPTSWKCKVTLEIISWKQSTLHSFAIQWHALHWRKLSCLYFKCSLNFISYMFCTIIRFHVALIFKFNDWRKQHKKV